MTLTNFDKSHIDGVLKVEQECFSSPWSREDIEYQLKNPNAHFIVAINDNKVVGYIGVNIICNEGYVTNVGVLKEYRKRGIAKALVNKALELQMDFLSLEVRKSNVIAIHLYTSLGFTNEGIRKNFYSSPTEDAIIMTKRKKD